MKKSIYITLNLLISSLLYVSLLNAQTLTDIDGNVYPTVTIGSQVWMQQNLRVTHYGNGDIIPNVLDSAAWPNLNIGARCYYDNDSVLNAFDYGCLYNWRAVIDERKLCPSGWHVATDFDWHDLVSYIDPSAQFQLGLESYTAGGDLKETGTLHWSPPNTGATNSSQFTALPGGLRSSVEFHGKNNLAYFWTSSNDPGDYPWDRRLGWDDTEVWRYGYSFDGGLSVRCIRDSLETKIIENSLIDNLLHVYPNPASEYVTITSIYPTNQSQGILFISDMHGTQFEALHFNGSTCTWNTNFVQSGIYFYRTVIDGEVVSGKIIIKK